MDQQDSTPPGRRTFIGLCLTALVLATLPGLAKAGDSDATPLKPFVTDGTLYTHDWVLDKKYCDEFSGNNLNTRKWVPDVPDWRAVNLSWNPQNVSVSDGKLILELKYDPHISNGKRDAYTGSIVASRKPILYGYFEARVKGAYPQPGVLPAFWLGGQAVILHNQTQDTEIDMLESSKRYRPPYQGLPMVTHMVHVFKHPDAPDLTHQTRPIWQYDVGGGPVKWDPFDHYHVYGLEWTPQLIKMYVDGKLQGQIYNRWWHKPLVLLFSLRVTGPYRKHSIAEGLPSRMSVDYVRVWQSAELDALPPLRPLLRRTLTLKEFIRGLSEEHPRYRVFRERRRIRQPYRPYFPPEGK